MSCAWTTEKDVRVLQIRYVGVGWIYRTENWNH